MKSMNQFGLKRKPRASTLSGFTLVELMVVVSIIGLMAGYATIGVSKKAELSELGQTVSFRIGDAAREAKLAGPISRSVAVFENDISRTRIQIATDNDGQFIAVDLRVADDNGQTSHFLELGRNYVPHGTLIYGVEEGVARTEVGGSVTAFSGYEFNCSSDGVCGPITFYLKTMGSPEKRTRVVVMPMSTKPLVLEGW